MTLKEELGYGLDALVLFRGLQQNPVIHALMEFCHADSSDLANQIRTYSSIVAALYPATDNLTDYMEKIVLEEETVYVQRIGAGEAVSDAMKKCLETELHLLQKIAVFPRPTNLEQPENRLGCRLPQTCCRHRQAWLWRICPVSYVYTGRNRRHHSNLLPRPD